MFKVIDSKKMVADQRVETMVLAQWFADYMNSKDATSYELYFGSKRFTVEKA